LNKLKDIKIHFEKEVSHINKNVAVEPVSSQDVLDLLNKRYNLGILKENFNMDMGIDTIGEHLIKTSFFSEKFRKEFTFYVKVVLRERKVVEKKTKA
jgi:ribosomal protein L9